MSVKNEIKCMKESTAACLFTFYLFPVTQGNLSSPQLLFRVLPVLRISYGDPSDGGWVHEFFLRAAAAAPGFSNIRRDDEPTTHVRFVDFG
jgi:hypothetical protein